MADEMTADEAFARAEELIEEARRTGATFLNFGHATIGEGVQEELPALANLPESISELSSITRLYLNNTQVGDAGVSALSGLSGLQTLNLGYTQVGDAGVSALSGLSGLQWLYLNDTQVGDAGVSALSGLSELQMLYLDNTQVGDAGVSALTGLSGLQLLYLDNTQVGDVGLTALAQTEGFLCPDGEWGDLFVGATPALQDAELKRIYGESRRGKRTQEIFAYLRNKAPRQAEPPADRPIGASYHWPDDGPISSDPVHAADADDELTDLRDELIEKAGALAASLTGSNEYTRLASTADRYRKRIDRPLADIRLDLLFSAANTLRQALQAHEVADRQGEVMKMLPAEVFEPLSDLMLTHGPFWLSFPEAKEIEANARSYLDGTRHPEERQAAQAIVESLAGQDSVLEPADQAALSDHFDAAAGQGDAAELAEKAGTGGVWNLLGTIGRKVLKVAKAAAVKVTGTALAAVIANDVVAWLQGNQTIIEKFLLLAQGPNGPAWLKSVLEALRFWK